MCVGGWVSVCLSVCLSLDMHKPVRCSSKAQTPSIRAPSSWASLYTDCNRMFPSPTRAENDGSRGTRVEGCARKCVSACLRAFVVCCTHKSIHARWKYAARTTHTSTHEACLSMSACMGACVHNNNNNNDNNNDNNAGGQRPALTTLCEEFPELFSGYPGGLLLRHLPVQAISRLSMAARSWRHLVQDPNVWKLLCALAWPGCKRSQVGSFGGSWRLMYMHRPRPRTDGVYVVKWSTQRHGRDEGRGMKEAGKDFYKPVIITLMYKVLLFHTGGAVTCLTTNMDTLPPEKLGWHLQRAELRAKTKKIQVCVCS